MPRVAQETGPHDASMIRKAIITVLTIATIVTAGVAMLSVDVPLVRWQAPDFQSPIQVLICAVEDGILDFRMLRKIHAFRMHRYSRLEFGGFSLRISCVPDYEGDVHYYYFLCLPLWGIVLLFGIYPAIALIRGPVRRRHRYKHGLCVKRGYDLTGNTSGLCPECAHPVPHR